METLAFTHSYATYEELAGIEYELPEFNLNGYKIPNSSWLFLLGVGVFLSSLTLAATPASAALYVKTNGACLNARTGPGTNYRKVKCVSNGAKLLPVVGNATVEGEKWYKLSSGRWVAAEYTSGSPGTSTPGNGGSVGGQTLQLGSKGPAVVALQQHLQKNFYPVGAVDGVYGPQTQSAVAAYQSQNGLNSTGKAGPATLKQMGLI